MKKSKYDLFILYDNSEDKLIKMVWDSSENGISQWRHFSEDGCWVVKDNKYLSKALKKYALIDRVPEHIHRRDCIKFLRENYKWAMKLEWKRGQINEARKS